MRALVVFELKLFVVPDEEGTSPGVQTFALLCYVPGAQEYGNFIARARCAGRIVNISWWTSHTCLDPVAFGHRRGHQTSGADPLTPSTLTTKNLLNKHDQT